VNDVSLFHPRCPNLDRLHFSRDHVC
jgi:hypothetical protein